MTYFRLLMNKLSKNRFNLIGIVFIVMFIVIVYLFGNYATTKNILAENIDLGNEYYIEQIKENEETLELAKQTNSYDEETYAPVVTNLKYYKYMTKNNLEVDDFFRPIRGFSFLDYVLRNFLFILISIGLCYSLSKVFCSNYYENIDLHKIIPIAKNYQFFCKLGLGIFIGLVLSTLICLTSLIAGGLACGLGSIHTPVMTYSINGAVEFKSFINYIFPFIILVLLNICFMTNLILMIAKLTHKSFTCMFVSLVVLIGGYAICTHIVPLFSFVHFIPFTYLNPMLVLNGECMMITGNASIKFIMGVIVLLISNLVLFGISYSLERN